MTNLTPAHPIHHAHQPKLHGCMYYAVYAITGDRRLLEYADDWSEGAWVARLVQRGMVPYKAFDTRVDDNGAPISRKGWERLRSLCHVHKIEALSFLVTIPSVRVEGFHLIAVQIPHRNFDAVTVSDSALPTGLQAFSWEDFLGSRYAQARQIEQLISADPDDYPFIQAAPVPLQETPQK